MTDILMFTLTGVHDHDDALTRAHLTARRYYGTRPYDLTRLAAHDMHTPSGTPPTQGYQVFVEVKAG